MTAHVQGWPCSCAHGRLPSKCRQKKTRAPLVQAVTSTGGVGDPSKRRAGRRTSGPQRVGSATGGFARLSLSQGRDEVYTDPIPAPRGGGEGEGIGLPRACRQRDREDMGTSQQLPGRTVAGPPPHGQAGRCRTCGLSLPAKHPLSRAQRAALSPPSPPSTPGRQIPVSAAPTPRSIQTPGRVTLPGGPASNFFSCFCRCSLSTLSLPLCSNGCELARLLQGGAQGMIPLGQVSRCLVPRNVGETDIAGPPAVLCPSPVARAFRGGNRGEMGRRSSSVGRAASHGFVPLPDVPWRSRCSCFPSVPFPSTVSVRKRVSNFSSYSAISFQFLFSFSSFFNAAHQFGCATHQH